MAPKTPVLVYTVQPLELPKLWALTVFRLSFLSQSLEHLSRQQDGHWNAYRQEETGQDQSSLTEDKTSHKDQNKNG
jgi:hypothetical protein